MVLLAGLSALVVVMGIGRFAYTPILPLMQDGEGFSEAVAGLIAMANYAGYFLAALFSFVFTKRGVRTVWLRTHFMLNVLTTGAMGWVESVPLWIIIRFLSGWSSGIVFVITSNMVLEPVVVRSHIQRGRPGDCVIRNGGASVERLGRMAWRLVGADGIQRFGRAAHLVWIAGCQFAIIKKCIRKAEDECRPEFFPK
jgi:hypothetical protein